MAEPDPMVARAYEVFRHRRKPTIVTNTADQWEKDLWEGPLQNLDPSDISYENDITDQGSMFSFASDEMLLYLMPGLCRICIEDRRYLSEFLWMIERLMKHFTSDERTYLHGLLLHLRWVDVVGNESEWDLSDLDEAIEKFE